MMIAPLVQSHPIERADRSWLDRRQRLAERRGALLSGALGFACFMPYPAVGIGSNTAIQLGTVLTLLMALPIFAATWHRRPYWIYPLILAPLFISTFKAALTGGGDPGLCFKSISLTATSCLTLVAVQLHAPRFARQLLTGVAVAMILHAAVGMWQLYAFSHGQFPFAWLYVNRSFLSVQDYATSIARYTQRPFGIFPEPSAMSSSLAPFVLLWMAQLCGLVQMKQETAKWQRILFTVAALGGLGLIIVSRSGHAAVTVAAVALFAGIWFLRCRATLRTYLAITLVFGMVLPVMLWLAAISLSDRLGGNSNLGNSSWEERTASLQAGYDLMANGGVATQLFGFGAGLASPALWNAARLEAVFSVLLTYVYETGFVGVLAVCCIGQYLLRVWRWQRFDVAFAAISLVWLVGITVTTSYDQLLPIWFALGWLSVWPSIFLPAWGWMPRRLPARQRLDASQHNGEGTPHPPVPSRWERT